MAAIVRSLWEKGNEEIDRHTLISLETADLNDANVSNRFIAIKNSLQDALQTDIANSGTSHAESLDGDTNGLASRCAKWIYTSSLSEIHPRGLREEELAEYLIAPGQSIVGMRDTLKDIYTNCWYIEQTNAGRYFFHRQQNINARINSYVKFCTDEDRDKQIETKLIEMFQPRVKGCYQELFVLSALDKVQLKRDKSTLAICKPETDIRRFFASEKFKNRVVFLTTEDQTGIFHVNRKAESLWAIQQVVNDLTPEDTQYRKAKDVLAEYQTELFLVLKSVFCKLYYPIVDDEYETVLVSTPLLTSFIGENPHQRIEFRNEEATKGEFVVEATLREVHKYRVFTPVLNQNNVDFYNILRNRVEGFLFPSTGRTTWEQILDGAASRGSIIWTKPNTLEQMRDALLTAGFWREDTGQIQKPPFVETTAVTVEYLRDKKTGKLTTSAIKLSYADTLLVREDDGDWITRSSEEPVESDAMLLEFKAVDSTGTNQEGTIYRIKNKIDIIHEFITSAKPNYQVLKVKCIPPSTSLKYTTDGSNPINNGRPYAKRGIESAEGSTIRLSAQNRGESRELQVYVPRPEDSYGIQINRDKSVSIKGEFFDLNTRLDVSKFLIHLPEGTHLQFVEVKITEASYDRYIRLNWSDRIPLNSRRVQEGFEYLDNQLANGEWNLIFDNITFKTGKDFLQWQSDADVKVDSKFIEQ